MNRERLIPIIKLIPDELFIKGLFLLKHKAFLDDKNPRSFSEKINAFKLSDTITSYSHLADKYEVRQFIINRIGEEYLNELYGSYDSADEIDFNNLPERFVIKATHGSGWNLICKDKSQLNPTETKRLLNSWLKVNYYNLGKEKIYKNIKPRLVVEEYLEDKNKQLLDYKFFCFKGIPKYVQIDVDRYTNHTRCFYDMDWKKEAFTVHFPFYEGEVLKPLHFDKMKDLSAELSRDFTFVRVDLYNVDGRIVFGELTFTPGNGYENFHPQRNDLMFGELME
jgi:hypothetical protein